MARADERMTRAARGIIGIMIATIRFGMLLPRMATRASTATTNITTMTAAPIAPSGRARQKRRAVVSQPSRAGSAPTWSMGRLIAMVSAIPDARVDPGVGDVHHEVHEDEHPGHQHY